MTRRFFTSALCAATLGVAMAGLEESTSDPFNLLFAPGFVDAKSRSRVDAGNPLVAVLPTRGRNLAVIGVTRTTASGERLAAWTRVVERLYQGPYVPAIGRFSERPQLGDVAGLTLEDEDLNDLRKCRPYDCGLKLSGQEMQDIHSAASVGKGSWKAAVQLAFRNMIVARARAYLERGVVGIPPYQDRKMSLSPAVESDDIAAHLGFLPLYGARVPRYLQSYPDTGTDAAESFLYWSKETLGAGKPIVSITHVAVFRNPRPEPAATVVAARQVYASHYLTGSLSLTLITTGADGNPAYLVYLRRSRTDAFDGAFGGFVRHIVEGRIRSDAPALLDALRRKLEAGDPPNAAPSSQGPS